MSTVETTQNKTNDHKKYLCQSWWTGRVGSIRFGVMLVIIGLIWMGVRMGYIPVVWFHSELFWPAAVIFIGFWVALKNIIRKHHSGSC